MTTLTYADLAPHERLVVGAFKLAMRELGVPDHQDGQCPDHWDCACLGKSAAVEARISELVSDPGFADAETCHDCHVLLPFPGEHVYAIDSASVCQQCAQARYGDQAAEYRIV